MAEPRNDQTELTWAYHDGTKHSAVSVRSSAHMLDFTNQPRPFKLYADDLPAVELTGHATAAGMPALKAVAGGSPAVPVPVTLESLSAVLWLSAGITKTRRFPGGEMGFRAAACTGALYHIELYMVTAGLEGLPAGVYHFGVHDNKLRLLREGDHRGVLAAATADEPSVASAPAVIVYTSTYWRNAWKYQARAYRHSFWDSGTMLANSLAAACANGLAASVVAGFVDGDVSALLDLDAEREVAVALLPLGPSGEQARPTGAVGRLGLATEALSRTEVDYPAIREMHAASSLQTAGEVAPWRGRGTRRPAPPAASPAVPLAEASAGDRLLEQVIMRRGSSRRFARAPVSFQQASTILRAAGHRVPLDATAAEDSGLGGIYVIANAIDGLEPGTYVYHADAQALEPLALGETRAAAAHLDLDQALGGDAAFNAYFLADLHQLLPLLGNRGYRAAHLDASVRAGRMYLAAYALGLGATGLTFYDDEVTDFFSPHASGMSVMFLMAFGSPQRRLGA